MINIMGLGWHDDSTYGGCQHCSDHLNVELARWKRHKVFVFTVLGTQFRLCAKALDQLKQEFADKVETAE